MTTLSSEIGIFEFEVIREIGQKIVEKMVESWSKIGRKLVENWRLEVENWRLEIRDRNFTKKWVPRGVGKASFKYL